MDKIDKLIEEGLGQLIKTNPALAGLGGAGLGAGAGALYNYATDGAEDYAEDASNDFIDRAADPSGTGMRGGRELDGRGIGSSVRALQRDGYVVDANNLAERMLNRSSAHIERDSIPIKMIRGLDPEAYQDLLKTHQQGLDTLGPENAQINSLLQTAAPGAIGGAGAAITAAMLANRKK